MKIGPALNERNLVFGYDTGRKPFSGFDHRVTSRRYSKGKPTVNFFPDGHFPNGTDMSSEGGSNPTNTIIELDNPGNSKYVLQQTMGVAYTEYQLYLSTQLSANTTYTLSGWYAESNDYSGASRMFHSRAYSSGGSHSTLGTGIYNVIQTKVVGGITWKYCYANITTPSDYSNTFYWFVGYSSSTYSGARYYTNLKMELGSYPTPYVDGTRSSTNSLIDLTRTSTIDVSNVSFGSNGLPTFDGTDDKMVISNFPHVWDGDVTFEAVASWNDDSRSILLGNYNVGANDINFEKLTSRKLRFYWNRGERDVYTGANVVTTTGDYHHVVMIRDTSANNFRFYVDGTLVYTASNVGTNVTSTGSTFRVGGDTRNGTTIHNGTIPVVKVYDRALTAREIKANFNQYKNRFGM